jgi:pimeloyl-ACP methyl ester carboxylesterase
VGGFTHDASTDRVLTLRDGRTLGYSVFGDPDGTPILNCHGGLLCRFDVEPCTPDLESLAAHVISPDRPGVGRSDRAPGRCTVDWVDDARELLDALGVERFAVMGWSLGGQYAAAVAARLGHRVTGAGIIAGCPPLDRHDTFVQLNRMDRRLARMSQRCAPVARATFGTMSWCGRHWPERFGKLEARRASGADRDLMAEHAEWLGRATGEGCRQPAGMVDEYRAFVAPWGFTLADIRVPTRVYQGSVDDLVAPSWADRIAGAVSNASVTVYEGEGHMIALKRRADVVSDLIATGG